MERVVSSDQVGFFNIVIFFIESSSVNKKNVIIKLAEPSERRKYVFFVA